MPAKVAWHSDSWPLMPVMSVMDRKMIDSARPSAKRGDPVARDPGDARHQEGHDQEPEPHPGGHVQPAVADRLTDGGAGGGSTDASGSELSSSCAQSGVEQQRADEDHEGEGGVRRSAASDAARGEIARPGGSRRRRARWPAPRAMGSERMLATAAAVRPATSRAVNWRGSVGLSVGGEREQEHPGQAGQHARQGPRPRRHAGGVDPLELGHAPALHHGPHLQADAGPPEHGHQRRHHHHGDHGGGDLTAVDAASRRCGRRRGRG